MKSYIASILLFFTILSVSAAQSFSNCKDGFMEVHFSRVSGDAVCQVRLSDESMKTNGLVLVDKFWATPEAYCLNPGYYYIGCNGAATVKVNYLDYNKDHDLTAAPHYKVLKLDQVKEEWTTVPSGHKRLDFDKSKPITGKPAYPKDPTTKGSDFTCDQAGYLSYLRKWSVEKKCTSRDPTTEEFKQRLEYFIDSCEKIHDWNMRDKYRMEFTFYADWHPTEFEKITTTKQR